MKKALFLVDPQCDFITGSLPVPDAEAAMDSLAEYLRVNPNEYALKIVTCDDHPHDHCSFRGNGGQWPPHCVRQSTGAAIWPALLDSLCQKGPLHILRKGQDSRQEEYSVFNSPGATAQIASLIDGLDAVDICGIAGDICVLNTLGDALALFGSDKFRVLAGFCPSLDGGAALADFCRHNSVEFIGRQIFPENS